MTTTIEQPKVGTKEWREHVVAKIRENHSNIGADAKVIVKAASAQIETDKGDPYKITARINTASMDRDREVVLPTGMIASEFDVSGSIFWNHDYNRPCGVAGKVSIIDGAVVGRATFLKRPEDYQGEWFPDFVRAWVSQMAEGGKSAGVSIGFIPVEVRRPTKKDISEFGDDIESVISKWKLLEWSIAPVQSNPDAVVQTIGKTAWKALFPGEPEPQEVIAPPRKRSLIVMAPNAKPSPPAKSSPRVIVVVPPKVKRAPQPRIKMSNVLLKAEAIRRKQLWA